jgi:hypothetical protein
MPLSHDEVVLLEFPDEASAYLSSCEKLGRNVGSSHVIPLDPTVRTWLRNYHMKCASALPYFTNEAQARLLRKAGVLHNWFEERLHLEDSLGISATYRNTLLWYLRHSVCFFLKQTEILDAVLKQHPGIRLMANHQHTNGASSQWVQPSERYLGIMAEELCGRRGIPFDPIDMSQSSFTKPTPMLKPMSATLNKPSWTELTAHRIGGWLHRKELRRMGLSAPLLTFSNAYHMDTLVEGIQKELPHIPWVVRGNAGKSKGALTLVYKAFQALTGIRASLSDDQYIGQAWPTLLEQNNRPDHKFESDLNQCLNDLVEEVNQEKELFSHRDIFFGKFLVSRLRTGIMSSMRKLHIQAKALDEMLELLQPRMIVTPVGREFFYALGELATRRGIPGLLISHGSFTPMKNDLEEIGWAYHADGMLHGSYTHCALQTPLAEAFAQQASPAKSLVRTGPLVWGHQVNRKRSESLRNKLLGKNSTDRVVLHASTYKLRHNVHPHIYENAEEYILGLNDLIASINQIPAVHLIIKFRPFYLTVNDLKEELQLSDRVTISVDEPFLDVLGLSDLLVSFSSTTIEEAFQNRVPVLLYGGGGRYQHVEALEITPQTEVEPQAVYAVKSRDFLADALTRILDTNGRPPLPAALFDPYVYRPEQITTLPDLVRELVGESACSDNASKESSHVGRRG